MHLVLAYVVFVGLGPLIFLGLIRPAPSAGRFLMGAASAVMLMAAAWAMRRVGGADPVAAMGGLAAMWLGWIVTIAMLVQVATLRFGRGWPRRWSAALGAAATVAPWFGLSWAVTAG